MIRLIAPIPSKSYSPELYALSEYFDGVDDIQFDLVEHSVNNENLSALEYDGMYLKMGFSPLWKPTRLAEIHDYASASTGSFARMKDALKTRMSSRPVLRSFLSDAVKDCFKFGDKVPYILRDMGVPGTFIAAGSSRQCSNEYDLMYAGSITPSRESAELFRAVEDAKLTVLAVGDPHPEIHEEFRYSQFVTFTGRMAYHSMPELSARCRYGINHTPVEWPFWFQTSTKVLEYLALGLPVISNDYSWVRKFEKESGARLARLEDIGQLSRGVLEFDFVIPDMHEYSWTSVFSRSRILPAIRQVFEDR